MKAIHRHIFQDAYEWAGEERVGPVGFMSKDGHSPLRDEFVAARFYSQDTGSNTRLAAVLSQAIELIEHGPATPPPL